MVFHSRLRTAPAVPYNDSMSFSKRTAAFVLLALVLLIVSPGTVLAESLNDVFNKLEQQYGLPQNILAKVANIESGGNPNAQAKGSSALGMFQWLTSSWENATRALYGRALMPGERRNPVESARVTAFALSQAKSRNGSLIQQAGVDMTLGLYMSHFLGQAGASRFFQAYIQNPGASAASLFPKEARANSSVFGGRTLAGVLNFFANKLKVVGVSVNVAGNFVDASGNSLAYSTDSLGANSFYPASYVPSGQDPGRTYQTNYQTTSGAGTTGTSGSGGTQTSGTYFPSITAPTSTTPYVAVDASSIIIAQSQAVKRGTPIIISWASVGMSEESPCSVQQGPASIGTANSATRILATSAASAVGQIVFTLSCTTAKGATAQQSVAVDLQ